MWVCKWASCLFVCFSNLWCFLNLWAQGTPHSGWFMGIAVGTEVFRTTQIPSTCQVLHDPSGKELYKKQECLVPLKARAVAWFYLYLPQGKLLHSIRNWEHPQHCTGVWFNTPAACRDLGSVSYKGPSLLPSPQSNLWAGKEFRISPSFSYRSITFSLVIMLVIDWRVVPCLLPFTARWLLDLFRVL